MFVFEDILLVNDKGIQSVLKEVDNQELGLALKTASEDLKQKIFKNMSERAGQLIQEDMQFMGPVRVSDVESGPAEDRRRRARLEDSGEIIIAGRGGEKEMVVIKAPNPKSETQKSQIRSEIRRKSEDPKSARAFCERASRLKQRSLLSDLGHLGFPSDFGFRIRICS